MRNTLTVAPLTGLPVAGLTSLPAKKPESRRVESAWAGAWSDMAVSASRTTPLSSAATGRFVVVCTCRG